MDYIIFLYVASSIIAIYGGIGVFNKYRNLGGLFFFLYALFASTWGILYFLFFSEFDLQVNTRLIISRIAYGISPIVLLSFLLFISLFRKTDNNIPLTEDIYKHRRIFIGYILFGIVIFYLSAFTDMIVYNIYLDSTLSVYRETSGALSWINTSIYIGFIPMAFILFNIVKHKLTYIDKIRLSKVVKGKFLFLSIIIFIQIILPMFGIWILEDAVVLFFSITVLIVAGIVKKYYFSPIGHELGRNIGIILIVGIITTLVWLNIRDSSYINENFTYALTLYYVCVILFSFYGATKILDKYLFTRIESTGNTKKMRDIKRGMSQFINYTELNDYIKQSFIGQFPSKDIEIIRLENKRDRQYFKRLFSILKEPILINDFVYLEENSVKFDLSSINSKMDDPFLCIPIIHQEINLIGLLIVGKKKYGDFYSKKEIEFLYDFSYILSIHMNYIAVYSQLQDVTRNLDRKVDEKTIEYNTLISRQKDFIATLSHEIKAPLTSSVLQIDNLVDEIDSGSVTTTGLREEVISISDSLAHSKTLLTQLFSTERLERQDAILYPERVDIIDLIQSQYAIQRKVHQNCNYELSTREKTLYANIDRTQFTQVLTNLFSNATKFANPKNSEVYVSIVKDGDNVVITIEDNGQGIAGIELEEIFQKYVIGNNSLGLGIGLYLCKRIVELHEGTITAKKGEKLSGIRMEIILPLGL